MSGLVSYSYDPNSDQELSDASNEHQQEKKVQNKLFSDLSSNVLTSCFIFQDQAEKQTSDIDR